ncbi:MAG: HAD hydrolase-like protein [Pseudomonadota bacterium]
MKYTHLVWDWNGTLLDDVDLALDVANGLFVELGLAPVSRARYLEIFDFPVQGYYERAGVDFTDLDFGTLSARYGAAFETRLGEAQLFADATRVLARLKTLGVAQYVLSSTEHQALARMIARFDLGAAFVDLQGLPDGLARGKTEVGFDLLANHQLHPNATLLIGDTRHDWEVAQALGVDCVLVATGHQSRERLAEFGVPVVGGLDDLLTWLQA